MVYIYHTINGVPYTTVYMHLLEIKVNVDDIVDTNTVVGLTGGLTTGAMNPSVLYLMLVRGVMIIVLVVVTYILE